MKKEMVIGKTNMDYLREFLTGNDEAIEFLDAVKDEIEEKDRLIKELRDEVAMYDESANSELNEYKETPDLEVIDFGIGTIEYTTDNLKLQMIMESIKDNPEKFLAL